jgi:hypothetical protein
MAGTCPTQRAQVRTVLWLENLNERGHWEDTDIDGMIILKFIWDGCGLVSSGWGEGQVADPCGHGNKPSVFIKCGEILDWRPMKKDSVAWSLWYGHMLYVKNYTLALYILKMKTHINELIKVFWWWHILINFTNVLDVAHRLGFLKRTRLPTAPSHSILRNFVFKRLDNGQHLKY